MKGCNGRTDLRILRGEHNHTGIQPLQLFPEKEEEKPDQPKQKAVSKKKKASKRLKRTADLAAKYPTTYIQP